MDIATSHVHNSLSLTAGLHCMAQETQSSKNCWDLAVKIAIKMVCVLKCFYVFIDVLSFVFWSSAVNANGG